MIIRLMIRAKKDSISTGKKSGLVFCLWGIPAQKLKAKIQKIATEENAMNMIAFETNCNPAAQGDKFCNTNNFQAINNTLMSLQLPPIHWLPKQAEVTTLTSHSMKFVNQTIELHKVFMERITSMQHEHLDPEKQSKLLQAIQSQPLQSFTHAMQQISCIPNLWALASKAQTFGDKNQNKTLPKACIAAFYIYTMASPFYRILNAKLRHPDCLVTAKPFLPYLRILHHAGSQALKHKVTLWRGVALHLPEYEKNKGQVIVWNTVSSTTPNKNVALSFIGIQGKRTLFRIDAKNALSIQAFSAFQSEEEYLLLPGTKLKIENVTHQPCGICLVHLLEV